MIQRTLEIKDVNVNQTLDINKLIDLICPEIPIGHRVRKINGLYPPVFNTITEKVDFILLTGFFWNDAIEFAEKENYNLTNPREIIQLFLSREGEIKGIVNREFYYLVSTKAIINHGLKRTFYIDVDYQHNLKRPIFFNTSFFGKDSVFVFKR